MNTSPNTAKRAAWGDYCRLSSEYEEAADLHRYTPNQDGSGGPDRYGRPEPAVCTAIRTGRNAALDTFRSHLDAELNAA